MAIARWYALAVHTRSERRAADALGSVVDDIFLPARIDRRAWSDRIQTVEVPLFPGYLLVKTAMTPEKRVSLLKVKHVVDVVGRQVGRSDVAPSVPDHEVVSLQTVLGLDRAMDPVEKLVKGTPVVVGAGPLKGVRGIVEEGVDGQRRLVVTIGLLGRGVRTRLSGDDVLHDVVTE